MMYNTETIFPGVAQLVARLLWEQDAASSSLATRTKKAEMAKPSLLFSFDTRLEQSNAARMSAAGEGSTEPNLYLRKAQMQTSLATRTKTTSPV